LGLEGAADLEGLPLAAGASMEASMAETDMGLSFFPPPAAAEEEDEEESLRPIGAGAAAAAWDGGFTLRHRV